MGKPSPDHPALPVPSTTAGRDGLAALLARPSRAVLALDFDGTLALIVPDPEQARAHPAVVPALARLGPALGSVVVITGRPAETAVRYAGVDGVTGLERLVVLGGYGAERWDAGSGELQTPPVPEEVAAARAELPEVIAKALGGADQSPAGASVAIEDKGRAFAVHTRRAPDPAGAFAALRPPLHALAERHGLIVEPGRLVLELRPPGMDKGSALAAHVERIGAEVVVYGGDDLGDLAAYAAVEELRGAGVPGLLLCSGSTEVTELAERSDLVVDGPAGMAALLGALADRLDCDRAG